MMKTTKRGFIRYSLARVALPADEYSAKTKMFSSLAPLGERGDRKAGGEGVSTKMN